MTWTFVDEMRRRVAHFEELVRTSTNPLDEQYYEARARRCRSALRLAELPPRGLPVTGESVGAVPRRPTLTGVAPPAAGSSRVRVAYPTRYRSTSGRTAR